MYKTILFDLDGTLLDTRIGVKKAVERTISQLDLSSLSEEVLNTFVGPPMQYSFEKHYNMDSDNALRAANLFRENYNKYSLFDALIYPGVMQLLDNLKTVGCQVVVATNKSHENAEKILQHFGILDKCDFMMGSDLQGKLKKKDIILECVKRVKTSPEECVYIGDSAFDSEGAEANGIDFIAVTYGFDFREGDLLENIRHVAVCNSVAEIEKFLLQ